MYVKKGDNIKRGAAIGKIYQDPDNKNKATLFFQIWKEKELLNPQLWLRKWKGQRDQEHRKALILEGIRPECDPRTEFLNLGV